MDDFMERRSEKRDRILKMEDSERRDGNGGPAEDDLAASLEEIAKLDGILKIKAIEEKKAKLSRIRTEEESRSVLTKLPCCSLPDRIQINLERFVKLLDEVATAEPDASRSGPEEADGAAGREAAIGGGEGKGSCRRRNPTFVQRNIRLAKCGRGTLSLTDEEKSRIENLLVDVGGAAGEPPAAEGGSDDDDGERSYAIDRRTKSVLGEIDRRLQVLAKSGDSRGAGSECGAPEKVGAESDSSEDAGSRKDGRQGEKRGSRLEEIDKLLNSMNSASEEEFVPLSEEEMESLVERSKRSLMEEAPGPSGDGCERPNAKPPQEVITELVSGAKRLMPKYKYRFDDS